MKNESKNQAENINNTNDKLLLSDVSKSVCRYYVANDCKDFQSHKGILYGICGSAYWCSYKDKPNKDDIVEGEL